jgi:LuxR family maltose regulon positive regulatory protein
MTTILPTGTKTCVPHLPAAWLRRPRLNDRLTALSQGDVMLVAAFAGSGKTTLLADWFAHDRTIDGAWLSLDQRDNEPSRLAGLLAHAVGLEAVLEGHRRRRWNDTLVLDRVLEELAAAGTPRILVIDDVHELTERDALLTLEHLVHHASPTLTLVLATRADPPIPLGRLAVDGRLEQIRADELALTQRETTDLLASHGVALDPAHVESLLARTEGWAAGVRLAAVALAAETDRVRFVTDTVQSEAVLSEYLLQEVLARLPDDQQQFLLRTCVAQPLTVELARVLSGDDDAAAQLVRLEHTGIFVTRADQPASQYRFHGLFGALLFAHLRHTQPALASELSRRAAQWFEAHGMPSEAESHAFQGADWVTAGRLACTRWVSDALRGSLRGTDVDLAPGAPCADVSELALLAAIDAATIRDRREAMLWRSRVDALRPPAADDAELGVARLLLDVSYGRAFGVDARALAACRALRESEIGADTAMLHALVRLREAELLLETDDDEATLRALLDARWRASRNAAQWIVDECDALLGLIAAVRGRLDACDALFAPSREHGASSADTRRLARALCDAQRGRLQSARALLTGEHASESTPYAVCVGLNEAARGLDVAIERNPGDAPQQCTFSAHIDIALGIIDDTVRDGAERDVANARTLLGRRRYAAVIELLQRFVEGSDQHVHLRTRIEALTLVAVAADAAGDAHLALAALRRALDLAAPADLRAPFLSHSALFAEVIDRYAWELGTDSRYAVELVDALHRDEPPAFLEPLTERERAVLDYLPTMMSNAEIAQQLLVSVNTIKTHLKAVYRKLGVERRRDAVVRARQLELL